MQAPRAEAYEPGRNPRRRRLLGEIAAVACLLGLFVGALAPTLDHPLLERHDFRQTQTAFPARIYHEEGIDLLHPRVPVLGEPFEIPFEFPVYQAAASLVMDLGFAEDTAMRITTLICFLATALLLHGLVRYVAGPLAAVASLVAFVVTPLAVVWSRASTIEFLATAGAVGFTWAFIVWRDNRQPAAAMFCLAAGLVGMLVKPTTAIFWLLPAVAYRPTGPKQITLRRDPWSVGLLVVPLVAAIAWTRHADAIKEATATTRWLTSSGLEGWNFGTWGNRVDPDIWHQIGKAYGELAISPVGLFMVGVVAVALVGSRVNQRAFWLAIACAALLPPLVFTNLYFIHEYYLAAVAPALAALTGLGVSRTFELLRPPRARVAVVAVGAVVFSIWFASGYRYWHSAYRGHATHEAAVLGLADELSRVTRPSNLVAVQGLDWSPALLYYARRRGHMIVSKNEEFAFDLIHEGPYARLFVKEPDETDLGFLSRWRWIGALGAHTYAIADEPEELAGVQLVSTTDADLADAARLRSPRAIDCGNPERIRAGALGTWLELGGRPPNARITGPSLAPLPARRLVYLGPELAESGTITLTCSGAERLSILRAWDAGPPG